MPGHKGFLEAVVYLGMIQQQQAQVPSPKAVSMRRLRQSRREAQTCYACEDAPEPGTKTCPEHKFMERVNKRRQRRQEMEEAA